MSLTDLIKGTPALRRVNPALTSRHQAGGVHVWHCGIVLCHGSGGSAVYKHSSKGFLMNHKFPLMTLFVHQENHEGKQVR